MEIESLSEKHKQILLWETPPEAFKEWIESLPKLDTHDYHPLYGVIGSILSALTGPPFIELDTSNEDLWLQLLIEALRDPKGGLGELPTLDKLDAYARKRIEQTRKGGRARDQEFGYTIPLDNFIRANNDTAEPFAIEPRSAKGIIACCLHLHKCCNGFTALKIASQLAELFKETVDVFLFSLLLHTIQPKVFPYWGMGDLFFKLGFKFEHDYIEFGFPEKCAFDPFEAYLDNCFLLYCSLHDIVTKTSYIVFDYAYQLLSPSEE